MPGKRNRAFAASIAFLHTMAVPLGAQMNRAWSMMRRTRASLRRRIIMDITSQKLLEMKYPRMLQRDRRGTAQLSAARTGDLGRSSRARKNSDGFSRLA